MINLIKKIFLPKKISFKFISRRNFVSKIIDENKKKVSYEPSAERARKLYKDSMEIMNIDKIKSPGFSLKNLLRCNKIISNDSKYELIGSQSIIDEFIDKKFNDTNTNLLEIDRQYAQIQTEEINLFEQLGTKYYEDDYDDNIINDDNQLQNNDGNKNEKASLSDENDIESTVLATFDNMNMIKSNADLEINASDGNKNFKVELTSVGSEIENKNNQKEAKVSKKRGKKPIVKVNETISPIIPLEITLDQGSMSLTTFPSLTHQTEGNTLKNDLLRKKEVKITKKINKQNKDYIEPIKEEEKLNELKSNQHDSDIQTKKEYLSNLIEHDGPTKNKKDHIESNHQEESSIAKQAKKPRKRVSKKIEPVVNVKDGGVYDFDSYLKGLLINEFDYYNTTRFLANNMTDFTDFTSLIENYIFKEEKLKKKRVPIENLGKHLLDNIAIKTTNINYTISIFKNNFLTFNKENIDNIKKEIIGIEKLTFIYNEKSLKGMLNKDMAGIYVFGDDKQIGSFFFNLGKLQNIKQSQLLMIFLNLIIHELITRNGKIDFQTSFVYIKKYDFEKNILPNKNCRDYLQITLRNLIRGMIINKSTNKSSIKFFSSRGLLNKFFIKDFQFTHDNIKLGTVCFQYN